MKYNYNREEALSRTARYLLEGLKLDDWGEYGNRAVADKFSKSYADQPELILQFYIELLGLQTEQMEREVKQESEALWEEALFINRTGQEPEDLRTKRMCAWINIYKSAGILPATQEIITYGQEHEQ